MSQCIPKHNNKKKRGKKKKLAQDDTVSTGAGIEPG
jgi:hypothetical protein